MQKQRVFVAVVVVVGIMTGVAFLSSTSFAASFAPIKKLLLLPQNEKIFTNPTPLKKPINLYPNLTNPPHELPLPLSTPSKNLTSSIPIPPLPSSPSSPNFLKEMRNSPLLPYLNPNLEAITAAPDVFKDDPLNITDKDGKKFKVILYWNEVYGSKHFGLGYGHKPFVLAGCRVNTCITTGDRNRYPLSQVDALVWHLRSNDKSLPKIRYPHINYVFWMMESASYPMTNVRRFNGLFNLTFTYRRDSDIYNGYGRLFLRRHPLPLPSEPVNYAKGKKKMAAWFVSNCHTRSNREQFVNELKTFIKVDIYGRCGSLQCSRSIHDKCLEMLQNEYKFYLSFENSLCQDYVTEKFFGALRVNVIPVVYGLGNYSAVAPSHSYIDALTFPSARDLAKYLNYLDSNDTAYNEYFWWKPYYQQPEDWSRKALAFCDLCERLHKDAPHKTYDLQKWFIEDSHCLSNHDQAVMKYKHVRISQKLLLRLSFGVIFVVFVLVILFFACSISESIPPSQ